MTPEENIDSIQYYLDFANETIRGNYEFLRKNSDIIENLNDLLIDAIKKYGTTRNVNDPNLILKTNKILTYQIAPQHNVGMAHRSAIIAFIYYLLIPNTTSITINLLNGNLSVCFYNLRLLTESLGKCLLIDYEGNLFDFDQAIERLKSLEKEPDQECKGRTISITQHLIRSGQILGDKDIFKNLFAECSGWLHTLPMFRRVHRYPVREGVSHNIPQESGIAVPLQYYYEDLENLKKLSKCIREYHELLKKTIEYLEKIASD